MLSAGLGQPPFPPRAGAAVWLTPGDLPVQCLLIPWQLGFPHPALSRLPSLAFHLVPAAALPVLQRELPTRCPWLWKIPLPSTAESFLFPGPGCPLDDNN